MKNFEVSDLEFVLKSYVDRSPFFGGCAYQLENGATVVVNYPTDQVESSLISHIKENPSNHCVSFG